MGGVLKYSTFVGVFFGLMACPSKSVSKDSEWISAGGKGASDVMVESDISETSGASETEWDTQQGGRTLPQDIQALTDLLITVSCEDSGAFYDPQFDKQQGMSNVSDKNEVVGQTSAELQDSRDKRIVGLGLLSGFVPALSKFGGDIKEHIVTAYF